MIAASIYPPIWRRLHRLKMESLEKHFRGLKAKRDVLLSKETVDGEKDADYARISKINDQWNRDVAEVRIARVARERAEEEDRILADIERRDAEREEQRRKINELVLKEKVRGITLELCPFCAPTLPD